MPVPDDQLRADRDRQFADWAETITFRQVQQSFDPQTQQLAETHDDTELQAVVGHLPTKPTPGTARRHSSASISFLVKAEQLPADPPDMTSRIVYRGDEYELVATHRDSRGLLYTLDARRAA